MSEFWAQAAALVWGPVTVALLVGTGIYLSFRVKFIHLRKFRLGWRFAAQGMEVPARAHEASSAIPGDISPWQSMMTMLAGAIGNGNIAGVATAIAIGGPGAVFWMWASGLFAMATKYSEAILGLKFREQLPDGSVAGGPMYYLRNGVRSPVLAWVFAFLAGMAAMTTGPLAQTNSMALVLHTEFHIPKWLTGIGITIGTWLVVIGGIKSIARFAEKLVPLKVLLYVGGSLYILLTHIQLLPQTIALILKSAFTPTAMVGGFSGASVLLAARLGAARGLYANEAGLGTAGMAYGAARSRNPVRQGLIATVDVFIITFVTCTMTALVVTITGKWTSGTMSTALVASAFNTSIPVVGGWMVAVSSFLFGYSNLVGWSYYGELCFGYIFRSNVVKIYAWIYCGLIFFGAITEVRTVWDYADTMNGLQIFPNLIALIILAPKVVEATRSYFNPTTLK
ncbi:MAG TPA: sodium:alanine symporter family protein [Thermodesulfobacteriota bacterium]|nr:sodium:alanine symporter family protein [Thermodesulfobacteriota bacterium]